MIVKLAKVLREALRTNRTIIFTVNENDSVVAIRFHGQKPEEDILAHLEKNGLQNVSLTLLSFTDCHLPVDKIVRHYWYAQGNGKIKGGQYMGTIDDLVLPQGQGPLHDQLNAACTAMKQVRLLAAA